MKHAYILLALPMAMFATQPMFDAPLPHPHFHDHDMAFGHMPPPELSPWMHGHMDGFREERMDKQAQHTVHFDAARAELKLATMRMARQAVVDAGANDETVDLDFQLQYGLADLGNSASRADADIHVDFSVDNQLSDLRIDALADADINADFVAEQVTEARMGKIDNTLADAEINAQFEALK
jgi:hypothetical protein